MYTKSTTDISFKNIGVIIESVLNIMLEDNLNYQDRKVNKQYLFHKIKRFENKTI